MIESFWEKHNTAISRQFLGTPKVVSQKGPGHYLFRDVNSVVSVQILSDEIIRVRLAPHGAFLEDFSYALQEYEFTPPQILFEDHAECYQLTTRAVIVRILKADFRVQFLTLAERILNEDALPMHWEENVEFGGYYVYSSKKMAADENFYGLGDKAGDLNLIRKRYTLWSTDAYAFEWNTDPLYRNYPFYIGLHGGEAYGLFYDNTYKTYFDFGMDTWDQVRYIAEGGELNYYFIAGPHMMDVVKRFGNLTGTAPMPPLWALGYHQCRWSYYPDSKLRELAKEFRQREIPCDALYLDIDYMDGYRCFTWDPEKFPDPAALTADLKAQGFRTAVIIDPGIKIDGDYWVFKEGKENGYFCRRGDDYYMEGPVWPGRCQFPDFTHPKVREWWGKLFKTLLEDGVEGYWTDMNEPSVFGLGTFPNDVRHFYDGYRGSHRKAHNVYGMQMARATYEGLRKLMRNKRPFVITRSCYAGTQRYAAAWTGDNIGTWSHLKLASIQMQRMAMSGFSFVGSDIGGFTGNAEAELFVRWMQVGAFSPFMRAHSSGDTIEREPWSYGPEVEAICKKYIELRYKLLPYIYSAFWENHRYGFPILRPVIMLEQEKPTNTYRQDEFTFGDKILVCPVLEQGAQGRVVYLPKGKWYHYDTLQLFEGNQENWVDAPLDTMPLFVRAGAVIPEYPVMQYTGQHEIKELLLNVYYADYPVNSFLYEDHGDTFAYEQDIYTEKKFYFEGGADHIQLTQSAQGLFTPRYEYYRIKLFGLPFTVKHILVDGQLKSDFYINDTHGTIEFLVYKIFETIRVVG